MEIQKSQAGVTLIGVLVGLAAMMVTVVAGMTLTSRMGTQQRVVERVNRLNIIRENLVTLIKNPDSWQATIEAAANTEMACLTNTDTTGSCATAGPFTFNLHLPSGTVYYASRTATAGFRRDFSGSDPTLETCNTFSSTAGGFQADCPTRVLLQWRPICSAFPCKSPKVEVTGTFVTSDTIHANLQFNPARYNFTIVRGADNQYNKFVVGERVTTVTNGGATAAPSPDDRTINYEFVDTGGDVVTGGGTFTVQPGVWECEVSAPATKVGGHKIQLVKVDPGDATEYVLIDGDTSWAPTGPQSNYQSRSTAVGKFTLHEATALKVRHHYGTANAATTAFGYAVPANFDAANYANVYTIVKCVKDI